MNGHRITGGAWGSCSSMQSSTFVSSMPPFHFENELDLSSSTLAVQSREKTLFMGKGDGKKKRKKKNASAAASPGSPTTPPNAMPEPQRVRSDINIPVRRQIRYAQMKKEAERSRGMSFRQTNAKRTKYRKTLDEEEEEVKRVERSKRGQEPDWEVILNRTSTAPLVIIDAYNVIHKWPRLKKWMTKGQLSKAREYLIHDLEELRTMKGWRIECVFDGMGRSTRGPLGDGPGGMQQADKIEQADRNTKKHVTDNGIRVVFSGIGASADTYIADRCLKAKNVTGGSLTSSFVVVSDDSIIRTAAQSSGAVSMSSQVLVDQLKAVKKALKYRVEAAVAAANGQSMRHASQHGTFGNTGFKNEAVVEYGKIRTKKGKKALAPNGSDNGALMDAKSKRRPTSALPPSWEAALREAEREKQERSAKREGNKGNR